MLGSGRPPDPVLEGWGGEGAVPAPTLGHHRPLGTTEELALESLGCMEARDNRFSVLDIPGCCRRAENGPGGGLVSPGLKGEGAEGEGAGWFLHGQESLVQSGLAVENARRPS